VYAITVFYFVYLIYKTSMFVSHIKVTLTELNWKLKKLQSQWLNSVHAS